MVEKITLCDIHNNDISIISFIHMISYSYDIIFCTLAFCMSDRLVAHITDNRIIQNKYNHSQESTHKINSVRHMSFAD